MIDTATPPPVLTTEHVNTTISAMEAQFPAVEVAPFDPDTIQAIGGVAVDRGTGNWIAVGRARIPGMYQAEQPLGAALEADLRATAEAANFANYQIQYAQQADMHRRLHLMSESSSEDDDEDDE